jgi:hypothetical protein
MVDDVQQVDMQSCTIGLHGGRVILNKNFIIAFMMFHKSIKHQIYEPILIEFKESN